MRDPTWADTLLAVILIAWGLFVVFGGLAAIGWWLGGLFSTQPGAPRGADTRPVGGRIRARVDFKVPAPSWTPPRPGEYVVFDDPDSTAQVLEDDREWHHDQRRGEGHDVCPECGTALLDPW